MNKQRPLFLSLNMVRLACLTAVIALFATPAPDLYAASPPAKLVAFWDFNDASDATRTLEKLHGYVGNVQGGAVFTADQGGRTGQAGDRAMDFGLGPDGTTVQVKARWLKAAFAGDQVTIAFWQKLTEKADSSAFWVSSATDDRAFQAHVPWSDGTVYFDTGGGQRIQQALDAAFVVTNWHHFAFVKNGTTKQIWVDGTLLLEDTNPNPLLTDITQLHIGSSSSGGTIHGKLDDFAIFGNALDATQIGLLAQGSSPASFDPDTDGDGMPDWWEDAYAFNKADPADATQDADTDGSNNLREYRQGTDPKNADTDGDGLKDGVETGTGIWVSATDRGTDPFNPDTDGDGLPDIAETNTGVFVGATDTGSNPNVNDTDGDGFPDGAEVAIGSDPTKQTVVPATPGGANLLVYWDFNDASAADKAVDKIHSFVGVVTNGAVYTADQGGHSGKAGDRAMDFGADSAGEVVQVDPALWVNVAASLDQMSVSLWLKLADLAESSAFWFVSPSVGGLRGFQAHAPWTDSTVYFDTGAADGSWSRINRGLLAFDPAFDTTQWHHYVFVKNGSRKQVWIDGKLLVEGNNADPLPADFSRFNIGAFSDGTGNIHGMIDDFAVYASALDAAQIGAIAQGTPPNNLDADADGDGLPDVWEIKYGLKPQDPSDSGLDPDGDGLTNLQEFQKKTDPKNPDTDGDGLNDGVETGTGIFVSPANTGTDPTTPDSDGDGLNDKVETATGTFVDATNTGTDPNRVDSDGDAFGDGAEVVLGSNPADKTSVPVTAGALNLLAYWDFNDASLTNRTRDKVRGIVGTFEGAAAYTADRGGHTGNAGDRAVDFGSDGAAELIRVSNANWVDAAGVLDQMSVSFWQQLHEVAASSAFWFSSDTTDRAFQAHVPWEDGTIYFDTGGCCTAAAHRISSDLATFDPAFDFTQWHHFAFTKDRTTKQVWIDGKLLLQGTNTAALPTDFTEFTIGGDTASGNILHGVIDEFAVFAAALTQQEVTQLAAGGTPTQLPQRVSINPGPIGIVRGVGKVTLSWDGAFKLLKADKVNGPYNEVMGATNQWDVSTVGSTEAYFKLSN